MWMPAQLWDDEDEAGKEQGPGGPGGEGVRGEKAMEWDEGMQSVDGDVETHRTVYGMSVYGMKDVLVRVWRQLDKISLAAPRATKARDNVSELDDEHDGDL